MAKEKKKIDALTPEQTAQFGHYVDKWIAVGSCTDRANRPAAEEGVRKAYQLAGKEPPKKFVWFESPLSGMIGVATYFYAQWKKIPLKDLTRKDVEEVVKMNIVNFHCYGQHEAGWLAFYDFFRTECGLVEETEKIEGLKQIAQNAGWWWCYEEVAFLTERHTVCKLNENNRIHCEDGPCVAYADGFELYAINGVVVPKKVIMEPEKLTVDEIRKEQNMEIKRIMVERHGPDKYLQGIGAKVIDEDFVIVDNTVPESEQIAMPRKLMRTPENEQYLVGTDGSTERVYYMNVNPDCKTCKEAHQSINGDIKESDIIANS